MSKVLPEIDFTNLHRNMIIAMCTTVCDANNESETNIAIRMNACKKNLLSLVLVNSTVVVIFGVYLTILVMVPVEAVFSGGLEPIMLFRITLVLLLTLGLDCQRRDTLKL